MNVTLYTTNCPRCKVLEKKLQMAGVDFTISEDINKMLELGFKAAPVLVIDGEEPYLFKEACDWADQQMNDRSI